MWSLIVNYKVRQCSSNGPESWKTSIKKDQHPDSEVWEQWFLNSVGSKTKREINYTAYPPVKIAVFPNLYNFVDFICLLIVFFLDLKILSTPKLFCNRGNIRGAACTLILMAFIAIKDNSRTSLSSNIPHSHSRIQIPSLTAGLLLLAFASKCPWTRHWTP